MAMVNRLVDILTFNTTKSISTAVAKVLPVAARLNFPTPTFHLDAVVHMGAWNEVYENLDVSALAHYEALFIIGGFFSPGSQIHRFSKRAGVFPKDGRQLRFQSTAEPLIHILTMLKIHNEYGTPLHEVVFDPLEMSLDLFNADFRPKHDYHLYHGYDSAAYGFKRLDSLQFYFDRFRSHKLYRPEKSLDFVFGYSNMNDGRSGFVEDIDALSNRFTKSQVLVKTSTDKSKWLNPDAYLELVSRAKYTMILPAYDKGSFPIFRLIESLQNDCLPLIHNSCGVDEVEQSYGVDLSGIVRDTPLREAARIEVLDYLKGKFLRVEKGFVER